MRLLGGVLLSMLVSCAAADPSPAPASHLFLWAGDAEGRSSDFLAVLDADRDSPHYGAVVTSIATGFAGSHPHHTEHEMPASGHLLANGFHAGRTWLFDLNQPRQPRILMSFGEVAGYSHPHTFVRLANGTVLTTFQYRARPEAAPSAGAHGAAPPVAERTTGGLVEMDERGTAIRSSSASDAAITDKWIYPYSVLPMPAFDRAISTTTDMDASNTKATSPWVQIWRLSDLTLLKSVALPAGPRGDEHQLSGEPRLLPDGRGVYIHTFNCGLYLLRGVDTNVPVATFVHGFSGKDCGIGTLTSHYWLQTVPETHALVALDIVEPEHPREVSTITLGDDEQPHWIAIDSAGRRIVLNSSGGGEGNRLFVIDFNPDDGALAIDHRFRDAGSDRPGIRLTDRSWPHGFTGKAVPHGTVFSR